MCKLPFFISFSNENESCDWRRVRRFSDGNAKAEDHTERDRNVCNEKKTCGGRIGSDKKVTFRHLMLKSKKTRFTRLQDTRRRGCYFSDLRWRLADINGTDVVLVKVYVSLTVLRGKDWCQSPCTRTCSLDSFSLWFYLVEVVVDWRSRSRSIYRQVTFSLCLRRSTNIVCRTLDFCVIPGSEDSSEGCKSVSVGLRHFFFFDASSTNEELL